MPFNLSLHSWNLLDYVLTDRQLKGGQKMSNDSFTFGSIQPRGHEFYFSPEAITQEQQAIEKLIREDNETQQAEVAKAIEIAEAQNSGLRAAIGLTEGENLARQSANDVRNFVLEADNFVPRVDLTRVDGYQEFPLITKPGSCVDRFPAYDFPWTSISGGGLGGVETRPGTVNGNLGGLCLFTIGGKAHVHSGAGFWFHTGQYSGPMEIYAHFTTYGRCSLSAFLSYASSQVRLNAGFRGWTEGRWMDISRTDIYNEWLVIGFTYRDFNQQHNVISARATVQPNRWYSVWGWTQIWTTIGGAASGGANIWTSLNRVQVCTDP